MTKKGITTTLKKVQEIISYNHNYSLRDNERYFLNPLCGRCEMPITDDRISKCRTCDEHYLPEIASEDEAEKRLVTDEDRNGNVLWLVFHEKCPCFCYECIECKETNVLEEDKDWEVEESCRHNEIRANLLDRLGFDDKDSVESALKVVREMKRRDGLNSPK